jgi:hypothetical protein
MSGAQATRKFRTVSLWASGVSSALAVASLALAIRSRWWPSAADRQAWAYAVVGLWVICPPLWFWVEWSFLTSGLSRHELEDMKHTHEVSRNIWLAFVVVLAVIFGVRWPGGEWTTYCTARQPLGEGEAAAGRVSWSVTGKRRRASADSRLPPGPAAVAA